MEMIQRILSNIVGQTLTTEELEAVAGGAMKLPTCTSGYVTMFGSDDIYQCDRD